MTPEATPGATPDKERPRLHQTLKVYLAASRRTKGMAPTPTRVCCTPGAETPPAETVVPQPNLEADQLRAQLQVEQQARIGLQRAQEDQQLHQSMVKMQADDNAAIMDSLRAQATGLKQQGYEDQAESGTF